LAEVLSRFPDAELVIHRLYGRDPAFRELCDDFEDAVAARRRWMSDRDRAGEFARLAGEIELEIAAVLKRPGR
jgi:hypothetical protein